MTAEQIYKKYKNFLSGITKEEAINAIRAIQKDAYKEAIKDLVSLMTDGKGYECSGDSSIEDVILRTLESVKEMNYESI